MRPNLQVPWRHQHQRHPRYQHALQGLQHSQQGRQCREMNVHRILLLPRPPAPTGLRRRQQQSSTAPRA